MAEFEQTVSLVSRIRRILQDYAFGDTIIFELVQNADDAAARDVQIILHCGQRGTPVPSFPVGGTPKAPDFRDPQLGWNAAHTSEAVPALFAYNSAVFSDGDFKNIRFLEGSSDHSKRHDATKVGRFGVGFNSAYHLTDVVAFVSRDCLVVLDPARQHIPLKNGHATGGMLWHYMNFREECATEAEAQFVDELLKRFEETSLSFSRSKPFDGTIFRLAVRQRASDLWREQHSIEALQRMLAVFAESARVSMVLLKHVQNIQALEVTRPATATETTNINPLFILSATPDKTAGRVKEKIGQWLKGYTLQMQALIAATSEDHYADTAPFRKKLPAPMAEHFTVEITRTLGPSLLEVERKRRAADRKEERQQRIKAAAVDAPPPPAAQAAKAQPAPASPPSPAPKGGIAGALGGWLRGRSSTAASPDNAAAAAAENDVGMADAPPAPAAPAQRLIMDDDGDIDDSAAFPATVTSIMHVAHQLGPGAGWEREGAEECQCWTAAAQAARNHLPIAVPWAASISEDGRPVAGRLLCFFPIKGTKALPVHLHAYFQLSSDRQSVADTAKSPWNRAMCTEVIPHSYAALLKARQAAKHPTYCLWPVADFTDPTIALFTKETVLLLAKQPLMLTPGTRPIALETAFVFPDDDVDVHRVMAAHLTGKAFATCTDMAELPFLKLLAEKAAEYGVKVHRPSASTYRSALKAHGSVKATCPPITAETAGRLFIKCTDDCEEGKYSGERILKCFQDLSEVQAPLLPLHGGKSGSWVRPRGAPPCLVATSDEIHACAASLGDMAARLVVAFGDSPDETLCKKRLEAFRQASVTQGLVALSPQTLAGELGALCTSPAFAAIAATKHVDPTTLPATSTSTTDPASPGANTPAMAAETEEDRITWTFAPDRRKATQAVPAATLWAVINRHTEPELLALPLLPVVPLGSALIEHSDAPGTLLPAVSCQNATVVALGERSEESAASAAAFELLVTLGASAVRPGIVPATLLFKWRLASAQAANAATAARVFTVAPNCRDLVDALQRLLVLDPRASDEKRLELAMRHSTLESAGSTVFDFVVEAQASLLVEDCQFLRSLAVFPDLWGRLVNLTSQLTLYTPVSVFAAAAADKGTGLPVNDPLYPLAAAHSALKSVTSGSFVWSQGALLPPPVSDPERNFLRLLDVKEASEAEIVALAAQALRLPVPGDMRACAPWAHLFKTLAVVFERKETSPLLVHAVKELAARPILPRLGAVPEAGSTSASTAVDTASDLMDRVAFNECVQPASVPDALLAVIRGFTARPPQAIGDKKSALGILAVPDARCVMGADTKTIASVLKLCSVTESITGDALVVLLRSFADCPVPYEPIAVAPSTTPGAPVTATATPARQRLSERHIAAAFTLLQAVERAAAMTGTLSDSHWAAMQSVEFVPALCLATGDAVLAAPSMCKLPKQARLAPRPGRYAVLTQRMPRTCAIPACTTAFGWDAAPPIFEVIAYLTSLDALPAEEFAHSKLLKAVTSSRGAIASAAAKLPPPPKYTTAPTPAQGLAAPAPPTTLTTAQQRHVADESVPAIYKHLEAALSVKFAAPTPAAAPADGSTSTTGTPVTQGTSSAQAQGTGPPTTSSEPGRETAEEVRQHLQTALRTLYIAGRGCVAISALARDAAARALEPEYTALDERFASDFPLLVAALQVPATHPPKVIIDVITEQFGRYTSKKPQQQQQQQQQQASTPTAGATSTTQRTAASPATATTAPAAAALAEPGQLSAAGRAKAVACLRYLNTACPAAELPTVARSLPVPTSDGGMRVACDVAYDYNLKAPEDPEAAVQGGTPSTLHPLVPAELAQALGIPSVGVRLVEAMRSGPGANTRPGFRARGQHQSVTNALKHILKEYADFQAVLLEMIQNADDAGADRIKFVLDMRTFSEKPEGLLGPGLSRCQGPSLCVMNSARFNSTDVDALLELKSGHKQGSAATIGRFGVGFNTVFHVTDCPVLVSGPWTVFLDPAVSHVEFATKDNPGLVIEHTYPELAFAAHFPEQCAPYAQYGVDFTKEFNGTLFRLPLRARPTPDSLSNETWAPTRILNMFKNFEPLLPHVLLFVHHLTRIEFSVINPDGQEQPLASATIPDGAAATSPVAQYRQSILAHLSARPEQQQPVDAATKIRVVTHAQGKEQDYAWFVCSHLKPLRSVPAVTTRNVPEELHHKLRPWVGCAFQINPATHAPADRPLPGRANCFLPIAATTSSPMHFHGCFALSPDRRSMWLDALGEAETSWEVLWNRLLLAVLMPGCILSALQRLRAQAPPLKTRIQQQQYYDLWPSPVTAKENPIVNEVCRPFFAQVMPGDKPVFWSEDKAAYVPYSTICFTVDDDEQLPMDIVKAVAADDIPLVGLPKTWVDFMRAETENSEHCAPPRRMTPELCADILSRRASAVTAPVVAFQHVYPGLFGISDRRRIDVASAVAKFIAKGSMDNEAFRGGGVPALMLEDGQSLGILRAGRNDAVPFFVPTARTYVISLFPTAKERIIHDVFWRNIQQDHSQYLPFVTDVTAGSVGAFLADLAPSFAKPVRPSAVPAEAAPGGEGRAAALAAADAGAAVEWECSKEQVRWVQSVWDLIEAAAISRGSATVTPALIQSCGDLAHCPVIPVSKGQRKCLLPLRSFDLLYGDTTPSPELASLLGTLGVWPIDPELPHDMRTKIKRLCGAGQSDASDLLKVLQRAKEHGKFEQLQGYQRDSLRLYLIELMDASQQRGFRAGFSMVMQVAGLSRDGRAEQIEQIRALPIFKVWGSDDPSGVMFDDAGTALSSYTSLTESSVALPSDIPVTALARGFFCDDCPKLKLARATAVAYFIQAFVPRLQRQEDLSDFLTIDEELELFRRIAHALPHASQEEQAQLRDAALVPQLQQLPPVSARCAIAAARATGALRAADPALPGSGRDAGTTNPEDDPEAVKQQQRDTTWRYQQPRLADFVEDFIVRRRVPYRHDLEEVGKHDVVRRIARIELERMARHTRHQPSRCVEPQLCPNAKYPEVCSMLLSTDPTFELQPVPSPLWNDGEIQRMLVTLGARRGTDTAATAAVFGRAVKILHDMAESRHPAAALDRAGFDIQQRRAHVDPSSAEAARPPVDPARALQGPLADTVTASTTALVLHDAATSLLQTVLRRQEHKEIIDSFADVAFLHTGICDEQLAAAGASTLVPGTIAQIVSHRRQPLQNCVTPTYGAICWTQRGVVPPQLKDLPLPAPTLDVVVAHIRALSIPQMQRALGPALFDKSIRSCYEFLQSPVMMARASMGAASDADPMDQAGDVFALPRPTDSGAHSGGNSTDALQDAEIRRFVARSCVITTAVRGAGTMLPYFAQTKDFAIDVRSTVATLAGASKLPHPTTVLNALDGARAAIKAERDPERQSTAKVRFEQTCNGATPMQVFVSLLHLLIASAEEHRLPLLDSALTAFDPISGDKTTPSAEAVALVTSVSSLRLPLENGAFAAVSESLMGDCPAMLERLDPGKMRLVDRRVPFGVLRKLGSASMLAVIHERALDWVLLPGPAPPTYQAWQRFFSTPCFLHAVRRVVETDEAAAQAEAAAAGIPGASPLTPTAVVRQRTATPVAQAQGQRDIVPATAAELVAGLRSVRLLPVRSIRCQVVDVRQPTVNLSRIGAKATAHFALERSASAAVTGLLIAVPDDAALTASAVAAAAAPLDVAAAINAAVQKRVRNLAPLVAVLQVVAAHPGFGADAVHPLLDRLGCVDLAASVPAPRALPPSSSTAVAPQAADGSSRHHPPSGIVSNKELARHGVCLLPPRATRRTVTAEGKTQVAFTELGVCLDPTSAVLHGRCVGVPDSSGILHYAAPAAVPATEDAATFDCSQPVVPHVPIR